MYSRLFLDVFVAMHPRRRPSRRNGEITGGLGSRDVCSCFANDAVITLELDKRRRELGWMDGWMHGWMNGCMDGWWNDYSHLCNELAYTGVHHYASGIEIYSSMHSTVHASAQCSICMAVALWKCDLCNVPLCSNCSAVRGRRPWIVCSHLHLGLCIYCTRRCWLQCEVCHQHVCSKCVQVSEELAMIVCSLECCNQHRHAPTVSPSMLWQRLPLMKNAEDRDDQKSCVIEEIENVSPASSSSD